MSFFARCYEALRANVFENCHFCSNGVSLAQNFRYKGSCLLVHKSLFGHTPEYISDLLTSVASIPSRSTLRASSCVATSSCRGHVDESATKPFCCCTASMEQVANGAETAAIDGLVKSSWSENISVSFCLRAPGYGLTLWCALGLLVGAQYKCFSYS